MRHARRPPEIGARFHQSGVAGQVAGNQIHLFHHGVNLDHVVAPQRGRRKHPCLVVRMRIFPADDAGELAESVQHAVALVHVNTQFAEAGVKLRAQHVHLLDQALGVVVRSFTGQGFRPAGHERKDHGAIPAGCAATGVAARDVRVAQFVVSNAIDLEVSAQHEQFLIGVEMLRRRPRPPGRIAHHGAGGAGLAVFAQDPDGRTVKASAPKVIAPGHRLRLNELDVGSGHCVLPMLQGNKNAIDLPAGQQCPEPRH